LRVFKTIIWGAVLLSMVSCNWFPKEAKPEAIARVGDEYLYKNDVIDLIPQGTSKEDSLQIIRTYIERWATQKLLTDVSEINLSANQKAEFDKLVSQYKIDLYTKAYLEQIIKTSIDTIVTNEEIKKYYDENKSNFRTNTLLAKLRYIKVPKEHQKFKVIKEKFFNPKKSDKPFWDTYLVQLNSAAMNDSVWVDLNQIYQKVSFVTPENYTQYIQAGKSFEYTEGDNVSFLKVNAVLGQNQESPLSYIEPTIRQLILNKRKLEYIKKIEKEITDDALKNNKYEIYE
jgi:hypothetical protein